MLSNSSRSLENNVSCFRFPVFQTDNIPELIVGFNSTVNFPLSVLTIVGNTLVLVAVWRTPSPCSPSIILLCGLATTDLAVGLLLWPLFLSMELTLLSNSSAYNCVLGKAFNTSSYTVCGVSLATLTAITIDRLLALKYHMRYSSIMTIQRAFCVIAMNWLTSSFLASLILWTSKLLFLFVMALVVAIFLCFSTSAYINISYIIRHHKRQILAQTRAVQDNSRINITRFKRTAFNTFLVHYFLLICYIPLFVTLLLQGNEERIPSESWKEYGSGIAWKLSSTVWSSWILRWILLSTVCVFKRFAPLWKSLFSAENVSKVELSS